jgi:hypothetical protein
VPSNQARTTFHGAVTSEAEVLSLGMVA